MEHVKTEAIAYLRRHFEYPIPRPVERATVPELLSSPRAAVIGDVRVHHPQVHAHHPSPRRARAALHAPDVRPGGLSPRRGEGLPRHRGHARGRLPDHRVRRRPQEQGLALHEAPLEAGDHRGADLRQAPLSHRHPHAGRHLPDPPVPDEAALSVQLRHARAEHQLRSSTSERTARRHPSSRSSPQLQAHGARRRVHAERQSVLGRQLPDHPLRRRHAGAPAEQDPRERARRARPPRAVIFVICEFQIIDRETEAPNELGEASHAQYKERQKKAVMRRLQLGGTGDSSGPIPTSSDVRKRK